MVGGTSISVRCKTVKPESLLGFERVVGGISALGGILEIAWEPDGS